MKEFIDREALYSEIVPHYKSANAFGSSRNVCKTWGKVLDMVQNAPGADVVEVVRCGDCKFCMTHKAVPHCIKAFAQPEVGLMDFCSYGERRNPNDHP